MSKSFILILCLLSTCITFAAEMPGQEFVNQRLEAGMPLGGIGTGKIELSTDGRFGELTLNNNFHQPIRDQQGCFAAIRVVSTSKTATRGLFSKNSESHGVQTVKFRGVYPIADLDFVDPDLPVTVHLRAFSPLIIGNERDSAIPAIAFQYTVTNPNKSEVDVSLAFSWENLIGIGGTVERVFDASGECIHPTVQRGDYTGIFFQFQGKTSLPQEQNAMGEYALLLQKDRKERISFLPFWKPEEAETAFWKPFEQQGEFPAVKNAPEKTTVQGKSRPAGAVASKRKIAAGGETTFVFILAWYMPHLFSPKKEDYGLFYANQYNSALDVALDLGKRRQNLLQSMESYRKQWLDSSLPPWLVGRMFNRLAALSDACVMLKDGRFCAFTGAENRPGNVGSPEEYLPAMQFFLQCYPRLWESLIRQYMNCQLVTGEIPSEVGNIYTSLGKGETPGGAIHRPDSACAFVLMGYEYYLWTGKEDFLDEIYPHLRTAILWLMNLDTDGDYIPDGMSLRSGEGEKTASLFTGDLWLAALRIGEEIGGWAEDTEFQSRCQTLRAQAAASMVSQLWNGQYFNRFFRSDQPLSADNDALFPEALPGEWFAAALGWRPLLEPEFVRKTCLTLTEEFRRGLMESEKKKISVSVSSLFPRQSYAGMSDAFCASTAVLNGHVDITLDFLRKTETTASQWYGSPWSIPLQNQKGREASLGAAGIWDFVSSMGGLQFDLHQQLLIVGPNPPQGYDPFSMPFFSPYYSGKLSQRRTNSTGQMECRLEFDRVSADQKMAFRQIAYRLPNGVDANKKLLRVLLNGTILPGQDFVRENLCAFGLENPLKLKTGDQLVLILGMKDCGKIIVQIPKKEILNLGAKCGVEKLTPISSAFSFNLINLLPDRQLVQLELGTPQEKEPILLLNGVEVGIAGGQSLPILLQTSPIPREDYEWLRFIRGACEKAAVRLAEVEGRQELKTRLWSMQEVVHQAVVADAALRGVRVDLLEGESKARIPSPKSVNPQEVQSAVARVKTEMQKFQKDLDRLTGDPVLASELNGIFLPITLNIASGKIGQGTQPLEVQVQTRNPLRLPVVMRLGLNLPAGWKFETPEDVSMDDRKQPAEEHSLNFLIHPTQSLWEHRFELAFTLSGTWDAIPFRRVAPFALGHEFLQRWLVIGPFPDREGEGFDRMYPPEINIKTRETYDGINQKVGWREQEFPDGYVDLKRILSPNMEVVGYAYLGVYSPREQPVRFEFSAAEGIKIFHNYKEIYAKKHLRNLLSEPEAIALKLFEGWNHILVKTDESLGQWGFHFEITDLNGASIPGLQYALDKA